MPRPLSKEELAIIEATKKEGEKYALDQVGKHGIRPAGALLKSAVFYLIVLIALLFLFSLIYTWQERLPETQTAIGCVRQSSS